ncbi:MAG: hypothetical protein QGH11_08140, partial [Pirellulaceae bacterium]|nr:hypothetical protein [Pirellulaceae bacterium]
QLAERSQLPSYRWQRTGSPQPLQEDRKNSEAVTETTGPVKPLVDVVGDGQDLGVAKPLVPPAPSRPQPPIPSDRTIASQTTPVSSGHPQASMVPGDEKQPVVEKSSPLQQTIHWKDLLGHNWLQQLKSLLAAIGAVTVLVQLARRS